jgi:hypothetical protein
MSKTAPFVIVNINMTSDNEIKSVFMGAKAVPVLRGLPGIGVALQLHEKPIGFFLETMNRYGDRVELGVLGRRVLLLTNPADVEIILIQNAADCRLLRSKVRMRLLRNALGLRSTSILLLHLARLWFN